MTLVSDLLSGIGSGVELINEQIFAANGTWSRPAAADADDMAEIIVWGAGGLASGTSAKAGGGACNRQFVRVRDLPASVSAIVAAATTGGAGLVGATSEFGKIKAYGGGGADGTNGRGTGGGIYSAGINGTAGGGDQRGGMPGGGYGETVNNHPGPFGGGANTSNSGGYQHAGEYGGGGAEGSATWGGAGADGTSIYGGDGATATADAQAPGGGGRGSETTSRRYGARGEIRVRIWRGI